MAATDELRDPHGLWLREQIRAAEELGDLWMLRAPVMRALSLRTESSRRWRADLRSGLETLFSGKTATSTFARLNAVAPVSRATAL